MNCIPEPSIRPLGRNWTKLQSMRETLAKHRHVKVSQVYWNEVLTYFFDRIERKNSIILDLKIEIVRLEHRIKKLGGTVEHKNNVIEEALLNMSRQPKAPVMMQANPMMVSNQLVPPPAPPSLPPGPPQPRLQYKPKDTGNLKQDYVNEVKMVFTGQIQKPSEILQLTQPKHKDSEVIEITEVPELIEMEDKSFYKVNGK